jgi:hypothetical protein
LEEAGESTIGTEGKEDSAWFFGSGKAAPVFNSGASMRTGAGSGERPIASTTLLM